MTEDKTYHWRMEHQIHYPLITELALSPDGSQFVYTVREPLMTAEESKMITHLTVSLPIVVQC